MQKRWKAISVYELTQMPDSWIKKHLTIVGFRGVEELRGKSCLELESVRHAKKGSVIQDLLQLQQTLNPH